MNLNRANSEICFGARPSPGAATSERFARLDRSEAFRLSPIAAPGTGALRRCEIAFTLIEICLAIAISAVVLIAINTLFFGALRLRDRVTAAAEQSLPMDNTIAVMKRDLMNIVPVGV